MKNILIISSSVRIDRKSHNVAQYFERYLTENNIATTEILDLKDYGFPIFDSVFKSLKAPSLYVLAFRDKIIAADGIIIVTPEYNGSIPSSLKNVIDLFNDEWFQKPIAFSTVSAGDFGGSQALTHLQFIFWKLHALTYTTNFPVAKVQDKFNDTGIPANKKQMDALAKPYIEGFIECIESSVAKQLA
ncbi:NAD(P)H-dependent oxidoreductase [Flavobacterium sp.]|uniref:NADPH-dependent FMN reductase n=1 Tax=Flavobacterium sp. TaxID=239 RepID=UPI00286CAE0E|nr:NAD(P)H-dependent oxidoreductase [Flavobacterium sp.]